MSDPSQIVRDALARLDTANTPKSNADYIQHWLDNYARIRRLNKLIASGTLWQFAARAAHNPSTAAFNSSEIPSSSEIPNNSTRTGET